MTYVLDDFDQPIPGEYVVPLRVGTDVLTALIGDGLAVADGDLVLVEGDTGPELSFSAGIAGGAQGVVTTDAEPDDDAMANGRFYLWYDGDSALYGKCKNADGDVFGPALIKDVD